MLHTDGDVAEGWTSYEQVCRQHDKLHLNKIGTRSYTKYANNRKRRQH